MDTEYSHGFTPYDVSRKLWSARKCSRHMKNLQIDKADDNKNT